MCSLDVDNMCIDAQCLQKFVFILDLKRRTYIVYHVGLEHNLKEYAALK